MRMSDWSSDVCSSDLLATDLYQMVATGFAPDYGKAAALGMSILSASIALIVLYRALTAESGKYVTISGRGYRLSTIELKRADRESTRLNSCHYCASRMPSSA